MQLPSWHPAVTGKKEPLPLVDNEPMLPRQDAKTGKFVKGNGGRTHGSRNSVTIACENLMIDEAGRITRKCIELALEGDPTALKLCIDRIYPVRKGRVLPKLTKSQEGEGSVNRLLRAVLEQEITPEEGVDVVNLIERAARVAAIQELTRVREMQAKEQIEAFRQLQASGAVKSGLMLVPFAPSNEEWERVAMESQAELVAEQGK